MTRTIGIAAGATLLVLAGAGAVAWAGPGRGDPAVREAAKACIEEARAANPDADRATLRPIVRECMSQGG